MKAALCYYRVDSLRNVRLSPLPHECTAKGTLLIGNDKPYTRPTLDHFDIDQDHIDFSGMPSHICRNCVIIHVDWFLSYKRFIKS